MKPTPQKQNGFTLIEIVIVLAIAALIMVIVFLAVQGAQRAQRDNTNKSAAGQALAQAEQFLANSSGVYPTTVMPASYVGSINTSTGAHPTTAVTTGAVSGVGEVVVVTRATCNATHTALATGNPTQAAVLWWSEGAGTTAATATQCISN